MYLRSTYILNLYNHIMKTFTQIRGWVNLDFGHTIINIEKVRKDGTKREFFRLRENWKAIYSTMFARLYDAKRVARLIIEKRAS